MHNTRSEEKQRNGDKANEKMSKKCEEKRF